MRHENDFARHGLFDARVPRYTSYPPANRFEPLDDSGPIVDWMEQVPTGASASFYMHIPFCRRLCWFCACRTQGTKTDAPVENYVRHLVREVELSANHLTQVKAARLHWGGGTPTLLSPALSRDIMNAFDTFFSRTDTCEFSVEIDPTEIDDARMETLAELGMNRASLGVQDFEPRVQAAIGREQSFEQTQYCVNKLRDLGVTNINLDILYGLPFQTESSLNSTLDLVIELDPERIAAFGYAHVPWMSRRQSLIPADALPDPRKRLAQFALLSERLTQAGYIQIGIDHFVKPTDALAKALANRTLHRNFQGYTDDTNTWLIGFGASAISRYPQGLLHNATSTANYLERIAAGEFAVKRGIEMTTSQHVTAALIESLMCYGRIDLEQIYFPDGDQFLIASRKLELLEAEYAPLVSLRDGRFHVARDAYPLLRIMAARLDDGALDGKSHAVAV